MKLDGEDFQKIVQDVMAVAPVNEGRSSSDVSGVLGARCKRVTWPQLVDFLSRRSQITAEEAGKLLDIVLKRYFDLDASGFEPETDLAQLLDIRNLMVKLGYAGAM